MSVKRPGRRYVGFRYLPASTPRREVARAVDMAWGNGPPEGRPRLLVCEAGAGILVVATAGSAAARKRLAGAPGLPVTFETVVTSGTIATVKARMGLSTARRRRRG